MIKVKVGSEVMHKGSWGQGTPTICKIESIERTKTYKCKDGDEVTCAVYKNGQWTFPTIFVLDNGHWAYGYQVTPIK